MIALPTAKCPFNIYHRLLFIIGICLFAACSGGNLEKQYRIGFAQCTGTENWKRATREAMARELSLHPGTELIYRSANDNSELQVRQIKDLLNQNIDILLVSPNEAKPLTSVVEEAYNRGIPVVVIDRRTASDLYTSFIGINNYELGRMAADYLAHCVHDTANIIEAIGLQGSTPSAERQRGFEDRVRQSPMMRIKARVYGDWLQDKSTAAFLKIRDQLAANDVVFAQNDPMALGAYEVYKSMGMERSAWFFGIDGLSGPGGGIQLVADHVLQATFLTPTGGEEAVKTAFSILEKQPYHKETIMPVVVIDSTNVRVMKQQTDRINDQTHDIEKQYALLLEQRRIYVNQRNLLYIAITALLLVGILGGIAFFALRNNRRINRRLAGQNEEILLQRNQLIEMTAKAKEATDAKFNFFTNISHEFRTPLTLILGPLEDVLASPKLHFTIKHNLQLVQKSALRLMRLINQLMDFRKIEENKMRLVVSENNITDFVSEIAGSFHEIARRKSIVFTIVSEVRDLRMWFDVNILDKVFFNLLSNAFKFTNENGTIGVTIGRDGDRLRIVVQDSGVGMTPEEVDHAFDLFYQGNKKAFKGTGLGLSLTKEMIHLHRGTISIQSAKWKGSIFTVTLPVRREQLGEIEIAPEKPQLQPSTEDISIYTSDIQPVNFSDEPAPASRDKEHSLLVIEDNDDLRGFLKKRLGSRYELHEAEDAASGIAKAYDLVPDLIISDIILPGEDGLHVTEMLKQDLRTSHIPIVLLTAKGAIEDQIKGIKLRADAFIVKPFNLEYLEETIKCLLNNRSVLREHYTSELPVEVRPGTTTKVTRKFINEFIAIVENNIPNEEFSVDDICKEIGISRVQLYRKVKALMGYNVNDYISTVRLQKAKFLLTDLQYSISEVASRVGYSSQAYFSTVFKSKFGITPSEYREKRGGSR